MIICKEAVDFLSGLEDNSVDSVVTSPPYNIGADYIGSVDKRSDYLEWMLKWITQAMRVSRLGLMLNIGSKVSDRGQLYHVMSAIAERFNVQNEIIWVKSVHIEGRTAGHFKPVNSTRFTNNTHELILHITKKKTLHDVNKLAVGVPFSDKSNIGRFSNNQGLDLRCRGSVWFVPYPTRTTGIAHPATFPVELVKMMILFIGGSSVVDPFAGSGSTALACKELGVIFSGCDISEYYVNLANRRLE